MAWLEVLGYHNTHSYHFLPRYYNSYYVTSFSPCPVLNAPEPLLLQIMSKRTTSLLRLQDQSILVPSANNLYILQLSLLSPHDTYLSMKFNFSPTPLLALKASHVVRYQF